MNDEMDFDLGPLTWVKGELDNALQAATQALTGWNGEDAAPLQSAAAHLHQVYGALQIVDLQGVALLTIETEHLLTNQANTPARRNKQAIDTASQAIVQIQSYLDGLMKGEAQTEMQLAPIYEEVLGRNGVDKPAPSELFYPDTLARAQRSEPELPLDDEARTRAIRKARLQYQKGLLQFLQNRSPAAGLSMMDEAVRTVEQIAPGPAQYTFWWTAAGLLDALRRGGITGDFWIKRLCGRIDLQMRRLMDGSKQLADRLFRDVLYYVAQDPNPSGRTAQARELFALERYLPRASSHVETEYLPILAKLQTILNSAKDHWMRYCSGRKESLEPFQHAVLALFEGSTRLPNTALQNLARMVNAVSKRLPGSVDATRNEALQLEMATALLLAQNAVDHFEHLGSEFDRQCDTQAMRLQAAIDPNYDASSIPQVDMLDDFTRAAQEKLVLAQVTQEIQANLNQAEDILDKFFRDPKQRANLPMVPTLLTQIIGALNILQLDVAAQLVKEAMRRVAYFSEQDANIDPADLDWVAEGLSYLGLYLEALRYGRDDSKALLNLLSKPMSGEPQEETVESHVRGEASQIKEAVQQWTEQGGSEQDRANLKANLAQLARDADLIADANLRARAEAASHALDNAAPPEQVRQAIEGISSPAPAPTPSAEALRLAAASDADIDQDILLTYIEEAHEVLGNIDRQLAQLHSSPFDKEAFTSTRRGFHTLKGSGRMVGLTDLAELAWEVEQTLNIWLRDDRAPNAAMLRFLGDTVAAFHVWVAELEQHGKAAVEADHLVKMAHRLRDGTEETPLPKADAGPQAGSAPAAGVNGTADNEADVDIGGHVLPQELFRIFSDEATQRLTTLHENLGNLGVPHHSGAWEAFIRAAHTLAGISRTTGFQPLAQAAHALELWAGNWADKTEPLATDINDTLEEVIGHLTEGVHGILEHRFPAPMPIVESLLAALGNGEKTPETPEIDAAMLAGLLDDDASAVETEATPDAPLAEADPEQEDLDDPLSDILDLVAASHIDDPDSDEPEDIIVADIPEADIEPTREMTALSDEPAHEAATPDDEPALAFPEDEPLVADEAAHAATPSFAAVSANDELDELLLPIFLEEAEGLLPQIGESLRNLRADPDAHAARDHLKRVLHTLKGSARMAGAMSLGETVHLVESHLIESGGITPALLDDLENAYDHIADHIEHLGGGAPPAPQPAAEMPPAAAPQETPQTAAQQPASPAPQTAAVVPPARPAEPAPRTDENVHLRQALRQKTDVLDTLLNEAGEVAIARARVENALQGYKQTAQELSGNVERLRSQLREMEIQAESQMRSRLSQMEDESQFDPLEFDRFSRLQELTRLLAESVNDVSTVQENLFSGLTEAEGALVHQSRMTRTLQQELMSIRMVPLNNLSERLHRVARQAAKETRRRAHLQIDGGQTELDRTVLERIAAPLEHLIRNAIAHGIELPHLREQAGKTEHGEVTLNARQGGNEIILTLSDDGAGINHAAIRERAVALGWLGPKDKASNEQLEAFLFRSGFTTATEVTEVAGRGVGLDVVRSEIAGIGGRVHLESTPGRGTRFTITLPLTLALSQVVLARAGGVTYALPSSMITLVREVRAEQINELHEIGEVKLGEEVFPLRTLAELVGRQSQAGEGRYRTLLLLRAGDQRLAVRVDGLEGNYEAVVKNIGPQLARIAGISGATVLGDGRVALIINPFQLAERAPHVEVEVEIEETELAPLVMVVDDSLTVRKITSRFLEREGFRVALARDGVEALEMLEDERPAVMLLDIEMPRMDGFEVARHVRSSTLTRDLPIIMITSRSAEKHRNHAQELGVNAYMGKPYQEDELLQEIRRLAGLADAGEVAGAFAQ